MIVNKKTRTCQIVDFEVLIDHWVKLKESKTKDKYLDLAREMKKTMKHESDRDTNCSWWTFSTITKELLQGQEDLEIRGQGGTIQTTALLRSARNTEKSPGDLDYSEKPSVNAGVKIHNRIKYW